MMLEYVYTNHHESAETAVVTTLSQAPVKWFTAHLASASGPSSGWTKHAHWDWRSEQRKCGFLPQQS